MAEQFLTLMADLDEESQKLMSGWYDTLKEAGFTGTQTPGLPYHISLATFPLEKEEEAVTLMQKVAEEFSPVSVHISHVGMFAGGKVLFGAPELNPALAALHEACAKETIQQYPWTPHATILIEEPETVYAALPVLMKSFHPFVGKITRLHLCAFWPTREIAAVELTGGK
ncbi:MAG: 2'-5' RNA ligase family protein [Lachnospiraceae bacterium]|nr:2'-5' RNA ligase family protein [Lachnospiraceae bacterium]